MGVSGQRHAPAALYPGQRISSTHWIGGWVGLRAGLDTEVREKKSFAPAWDRTRTRKESALTYRSLRDDSFIRSFLFPVPLNKIMINPLQTSGNYMSQLP
jgi:hypothetical protein